ncbi:GIY-YIG nuclease family protein [Saccharicrinis aurantiacus]|uniref:GIY-YIG nuclease family protein n=1 Tax=Saccharicrinis aurantiacus TaxID=1849719 RepID=UPI002491A174|nr:GIY-YIG nuclease family protein [Saccharicrinis aurantiacus]
MYGKSIKIFLADNSASGLRHVEIVNWSGQAVACPRSKFSELKKWDESQRPGVYFLLEQHATDGKNTVYIGESENVYERLTSHLRNKDFWSEVIFFSSKDENLTKGHIKYLESRLTEITLDADRYALANANTPPQSALPRSEKAAMEEYLHNIKLVLGTLGHPLLEKLSQGTNCPILNNEEEASNGEQELSFTVKNATAMGKQVDEGFLLLKGSGALLQENKSFPPKIKTKRDQLIKEGIILKQNDLYILQKDVLMSSPSYAACLIAGTARNGQECWKNTDGKTLKQVEEDLIN